MADVLSILELVVYIILISPVAYIVMKHGKKGILGWLSIQLFCLARIIGDILNLKDGPKSEAATIVNSVGLSPLILGTLGILHEARQLRHMNLDRTRERVLVISFHTFLSIGMTMIVVGIMHTIDGKDTNNAKLLMRLGMTILVISYFVVVAWLIWSTTESQIEMTSPGFESGSILIRSIIIALPFLGIRLIYGIVTFVDLLNSDTSAAFATKDVYKYTLSAVPDLLVVLAYLWAGFVTRHVQNVLNSKKYKPMHIAGSHHPGPDAIPLTYITQHQNAPYRSNM